MSISLTLYGFVYNVVAIGARWAGVLGVVCVDECRDSVAELIIAPELESAEELGMQTSSLDLGVKPADFNAYLDRRASGVSGSSAARSAVVDLNGLDYKDVALLQSYLSELGHILPRVETGLSSKQHRKLVKEVKKSRYLGLLPFSLY
ncbi:30S ribosomal protein S18 [Candidatus Hodgkinia cicadicola]|nr:30S ribosomal protein S18 [Candidatus Hodgkinia cicadicola]